MRKRLQELAARTQALRQDMWRTHGMEASRGKQLAFSVARVISITLSGLKENRIMARAAALSFSSLLGLGPMIALAALLSGFVLDKTQPDMAQETIENLIAYIAPQVTLAAEGDSSARQQGEFSEMISQFIQASQSGTVGIGGTLVLILIVIQLFISIEDAFNDIWGVSKGRSTGSRIVFYWTFVSLGTVLVFAGVALALSELIQINERLSEFAQDLSGSKTFGSWLAESGRQLAGILLASSALSAFFKFMPNTKVEWKAAFAGSLFTVTCFVLNNALAFLYIERIAMQRTLYGSLALPLILMIGLFTFWFCLLLGGKLSFAIQNARFRSGRVVWDELSPASQESLCLLLLGQVARRFREGEEPPSTASLSESNNIPSALTEAALARLSSLGLASIIPNKEQDISQDQSYQPAKPLEKISLLRFKRSFETCGEDMEAITDFTKEPIVELYRSLLHRARTDSIGSLSLSEALQRTDRTSQSKGEGPR